MLVVYVLYLVNKKAFMFVYLTWYFLLFLKTKLELMVSHGRLKHILVSNSSLQLDFLNFPWLSLRTADLLKLSCFLWAAAIYSSFSKPAFSNISTRRNHLEGVLTHRLVGSSTRVSDLGGLWQGLRTCISPDSQVMLALLVQVSHVQNHCSLSPC